MARVRGRRGSGGFQFDPRYFDGGRPVERKRRDNRPNPGKRPEDQFTAPRREALGSVGPTTMASPDGGGFVYFSEFDRELEWLRLAGLVELLPARREGGARQVVRTPEGERVLTLWTERG
jgi:hypothetical protein